METQGVDIHSEQPRDENMEAAKAEAAGEQQEQPQDGGEQLLAGKYESPADLEKAYLELQSKLGSKPKTDTEEADGPAFQIKKEGAVPADPKEFVERVEQQWATEGRLSDEMREEIRKNGLPPGEYLDNWMDQHETSISGAREARTAAIRGMFGNEDRMKQVLGWADANLTDAEIAAIETQANSQDIGVCESAIKGLIARFDTSPMGATGIEGNAGGPAIAPFRSNEETTAAMNDPRYRTDPAYRKEVERRLAAT